MLYKALAIRAPINGPTTGTQAYVTSNAALFLIGSKACMIRGPKSRAGFIAYPVVPPRDRPITQTKKVTGIAPIDPKPIVLESAIFASVK